MEEGLGTRSRPCSKITIKADVLSRHMHLRTHGNLEDPSNRDPGNNQTGKLHRKHGPEAWSGVLFRSMRNFKHRDGRCFAIPRSMKLRNPGHQTQGFMRAVVNTIFVYSLKSWHGSMFQAHQEGTLLSNAAPLAS